jgi:FLVCR family feline leukemia virus subgroup C receptor-related protein
MKTVSLKEKSTIDYSGMKPQVVPQRWIQLGYLSLLALLSDWVCFSVAAAPTTFESNFDHSAASIIDIFLFTNVATSFLVTDVVAKFGLQRAIQGAALFMTAGCWLRSGLGFLPTMGGSDNVLVSYPLVVAGTVLVGTWEFLIWCCSCCNVGFLRPSHDVLYVSTQALRNLFFNAPLLC